AELGSRTDIYALGCVLYEMLAGEPPFTGPTPQAVTAKRLADPVPSVRHRRAEVSEQLEAALRRALAKAPFDRFATAAELAPAVVEAGAAPEATRSSGTGRVRRFRALGALAAGLAVAVALLLHLAQRDRTDPRRVMVAVLANRTGNPALDPVGLTAADYINRGLLQTG